MQFFSLVSLIRATKLKLKLTATIFTMIASLQNNCNMKEMSLRPYEKERVIQQKSDISLPRYCKLQELFRSGLKEMKQATTTQISNSSLLFKSVAATEVTALCKKQTTLRTESLLIQTVFLFCIRSCIRIQTTRKFANASYEPHYAIAERHLIFLYICKMVLQNNG